MSTSASSSVETTPSQESERAFAARVDALAADPQRRHELSALLDERHPSYEQRGTAASARMRGWILCALTRGGLPPSFVVFALEELDNGREAYLVACAARALRSCDKPSEKLASYLGKALSNIRFHDDALALDRYGGYAIGFPDTTAVREILLTIAWLGPLARSLAPVLAQLSEHGALSRLERDAYERAVSAIREPTQDLPNCCGTNADLSFLRDLGTLKEWTRSKRRTNPQSSSIVFEDQLGRQVDYDTFFRGKPAIVAFFYTRCDNPEKCSLTVTKLGQLVRTLAQRGLATSIRTAAISYDPLWDVPDRLLGYANSRKLTCDDDHRVLRAIAGAEALRAHFELGVSFVASLVNRHRVELFVLDEQGRIAASFTRLQWAPESVIERAVSLLEEARLQDDAKRDLADSKVRSSAVTSARKDSTTALMVGPGFALASALLPKCPVCWSAYLSVFGIASLPWPAAPSWLIPTFCILMLTQLISVLRRCRVQRSWLPFALSTLGAGAILVGRFALESPLLGWLGVALSLLGAVAGVFNRLPDRSLLSKTHGPSHTQTIQYGALRKAERILFAAADKD